MLILIYLIIAAGLIAGVVYLARLITEEDETVGQNAPLLFANETEEVSADNFERLHDEGTKLYNIHEHGIPFPYAPLP